MKKEEALTLIQKSLSGFRVKFQIKKENSLEDDFFPEIGEPLFSSVDEAWKVAKLFSEVDKDRYVNIYVVNEIWKAVDNGVVETLNEYRAWE